MKQSLLLTDWLGVGASWFQIQKARYSLPAPPGPPTAPAIVAGNRKVSGLTPGSVFWRNLTGFFALHACQALALAKTRQFQEPYDLSSSHSCCNGSYEPDAGIIFDPARLTSVGVGLGCSRVSMSQARITGSPLRFSRGF